MSLNSTSKTRACVCVFSACDVPCVSVRHSAHQVHVEAELSNAKRELDQMKRGHLAVRTDLREHTSEWREAAEGVGRVLRHHIYSHTRWERSVVRLEKKASLVSRIQHKRRVLIKANKESCENW